MLAKGAPGWCILPVVNEYFNLINDTGIAENGLFMKRQTKIWFWHITMPWTPTWGSHAGTADNKTLWWCKQLYHDTYGIVNYTRLIPAYLSATYHSWSICSFMHSSICQFSTIYAQTGLNLDLSGTFIAGRNVIHAKPYIILFLTVFFKLNLSHLCINCI